MMNRIHIIILSVLIMLGFPACVETLQEPDSAGKLYLNLHSTICSTKVSVQETSSETYMAFWKNGESSTVIMEHSDGYQDVEGTVTSEDSRWANLAVAFDSYPQSNSYTYYSVIPASNYRGYKDGTISVYVPSEQSPTGYSSDSSASVLIGRSEVFSVQPGGDQDNPQDINMSFNFATAFGKCSVTGYPEGERLLQINIISETQALCGRADLNEDGELSFVDEENKLVVTVCDSSNIWFASYPGEHECWYVEALTERGIYTKKISKKLVLKTGVVAEFSVDMTGAAFAEHEPIRYAKSLTPSTDIDYISVYGGADIQGTLVKGIWYWSERGAEYVFDDVPGIGAYRLSIATYYWVNEDTSIGVSVNGSDLTSYTILSTEHNAGNYTLVIDDVFLVKGLNTIRITNGAYMGADPNANPWYPNIGTVAVSNDHIFPQLKLSKSTLEFTHKGGTETVEAVLLNSTETISAVSSKPEYASVSVVGNEITVTVIENTLYESLNAEITVTAGDLTQTLYVIQTGAPEPMVPYTSSLVPGGENVEVFGGADIQGTLVKGIWYWTERGANYIFDDVPASGAYRLLIDTYYWVREDTSIGISVNGSAIKSYTILSSEHNAGNYTLIIDDVFLVKGLNTIKITNGDYMGANPDANPWYPNIGTVTVSNEHNLPQLELSKSTLEFTHKGGTETVEAVLLNSTETISAVSSKPECVSVLVAGNKITVTVSENTLHESLNAEITITAGGLTQTLNVIQAGAPESMVSYTASLEPGSEHVKVFGGADIQGTLVKGIWYWTERGADYEFDNIPASGAYRLLIDTYYWVREDTSIGVSVNGSAIKSYTILATEHNAGNYTVVIDNVFLNKGFNTIKITKGDYLGVNPNANPFYPNVGKITITNNY